jgi:hypothetical protein
MGMAAQAFSGTERLKGLTGEKPLVIHANASNDTISIFEGRNYDLLCDKRGKKMYVVYCCFTETQEVKNRFRSWFFTFLSGVIVYAADIRSRRLSTASRL